MEKKRVKVKIGAKEIKKLSLRRLTSGAGVVDALLADPVGVESLGESVAETAEALPAGYDEALSDGASGLVDLSSVGGSESTEGEGETAGCSGPEVTDGFESRETVPATPCEGKGVDASWQTQVLGGVRPGFDEMNYQKKD